MARFFVTLAALLGLLVPLAPLHAQSQPEGADAQLDKRLDEYGKIQEQLLSLFQQKEYEKAAAACQKQMQLVPESSEPHYNLACAMARLGKKDAALLELNQAVELGFKDSAHAREDEDLASLHDEPKFKALLKSIREKELNAPHENSTDIAGVKTIENFPEGGLRYRLRMSPKADAKNPARLLIWLHPSGASMDSIIEDLSPMFARDGFALLVLTQMNYKFWTSEDAAALMEKTLPDVAKIEGVDAKKPVLIGFSAGGQLALQLWQHNPADFGGLVLDAAYPLDTEKFASGQVEPMTLPKGDAVKSCPIFALVGGADGGAGLWKHVEKSWHDAQIPLTLHIMPRKGHAWLFFDNAERGSLHDWLKRVSAGELPSDSGKNKLPLPGDEENPPIKV